MNKSAGKFGVRSVSIHWLSKNGIVLIQFKSFNSSHLTQYHPRTIRPMHNKQKTTSNSVYQSLPGLSNHIILWPLRSILPKRRKYRLAHVSSSLSMVYYCSSEFATRLCDAIGRQQSSAKCWNSNE